MKALITIILIISFNFSFANTTATAEYCQDNNTIEISTRKGVTALKVIGVVDRAAGKIYTTENGYKIYVVGNKIRGYKK